MKQQSTAHRVAAPAASGAALVLHREYRPEVCRYNISVLVVAETVFLLLQTSTQQCLVMARFAGLSSCDIGTGA